MNSQTRLSLHSKLAAFRKLRARGNSHVILILSIGLAFAWCSSAPSAQAATTVFIPVADTSLLEISPTNNLGGFAGMNSGTTQEYYKTRALMRFDLSSLPTNTLVLSAKVQLEVTRQPDEPPNNSTFGLRRMLVPWGEGNKNPPSQPGKGLPATSGEATWTHAFYPTNAWNSPGGTMGIDYSSDESAFTEIYGTAQSPYVFASTPEMVEDTTRWIVNSNANFGWLLLCNEEHLNFTARRFGSREDSNNPPLLELEYLVPPTLRIVKTNALQTQLHFLAWADHAYDILYRHSQTSGNWQLLTHLSATPTNYAAVVIDSASVTQRFYRVIAY